MISDSLYILYLIWNKYRNEYFSLFLLKIKILELSHSIQVQGEIYEVAIS